MNIEIDVPDGKSNDWAVSTFEVSKEEARIFNFRACFNPGLRIISPGKYKKLTRNGAIIMSNTPAEIQDHSYFIYKAKENKHILINGLGLGVCLKGILDSDTIETITVIEKSKDVINLVAPTYKDKRVNIINADAYEWKPPKGIRYNVVWHDIWNDICSDNLPEMTKLHRKYGEKTDWQDSWCKSLCKERRITERKIFGKEIKDIGETNA